MEKRDEIRYWQDACRMDPRAVEYLVDEIQRYREDGAHWRKEIQEWTRRAYVAQMELIELRKRRAAKEDDGKA